MKVTPIRKFLSSILVVVLLCSICVCASADAQSYTATAPGFGGDVTVTIEVTDETISAVEVVGDGETQGIGSNAIEKLPAKILEAGTYDVDSVSGCTFSSNAVKQATRDAMIQAGLVSNGSSEVKMAPGT